MCSSGPWGGWLAVCGNSALCSQMPAFLHPASELASKNAQWLYLNYGDFTLFSSTADNFANNEEIGGFKNIYTTSLIMLQQHELAA